MKKNLRIVSAAAAALLAVAPVAATAMPVSAAPVQNIVLGTNNAPAVNADITVSSNLQATTRPEKATTNLNTGVTTYSEWDGKVNGTISASFGGQTYTGNLADQTVAQVYELKSGKKADKLSNFTEVKPGETGKYRLEPGKKYYVRVNNVSFNFGSANANKKNLVLAGSNGVLFVLPQDTPKLANGVSVDVNGLKVAKAADDNLAGFVSASDKAAKAKLDSTVEHAAINGLNVVKTSSISTNKTANVIHVGTTNSVVRYESNSGTVHYAYVSNSELNASLAKNTTTVSGSNDRFYGIETDRNGVMNAKLDVLAPITPVDVTNSKSVSFYEIANGNEVTTGSLNLTANPTSHELNVNAVLAAAKAKYAAHQLENGASNGANVSVTTDVKDLTDQLTKAGLKVDALGNFEAPASFSFNLTAKSAQNAATKTLPVTVSVANAVQTPAAQETTRTVKIMHISTIYDKNGKATHEPALRAYHTVSVVSDPVSLKDEKGNDAGKFYKLAGKDQYIKVGNVDGTKRTLKHNSYVYKSTGKRRGKTVLKKGSSVTTYGKSFMIAGHQMYRIGENKYVKKANF